MTGQKLLGGGQSPHVGGAGCAGAGGFLWSLHCVPHQIWTQGISSVRLRRRDQGDRQVSEKQEHPHWPPRGPQPQESPGSRLWILLQKPRTPLGQRLRAQRVLLSARLLCLVMWLGQTQGHVKSDMKSPPERQMVTRRGDRGWKSRGSSQAKTLCPVGEWSPSCYPEHPEGLSPRWAGSLSGHTMGGGAPNM